MQESGAALCWYGAENPLWKGREDMQKDDFKGLKWQTKPRKSVTLCGLGMTWEGEFCQESVCGYPKESLFQRETALRMFRPSNLPLAFWEGLCRGEPQASGLCSLSKLRQLRLSKAQIHILLECLCEAECCEGNELKVNQTGKS